MYLKEEFASCGKGTIHVSIWKPDGPVQGIVQILHGIAEYSLRYGDFARFLNEHGYMVVAEDHMGHGQSGGEDCVRGYFYGGWFAAVQDSYTLMQSTMQKNPNVPYILFGHSMGSFMARTILTDHPNSGITAGIICGTGWMPSAVLHAGSMMGAAVCGIRGAQKPSSFLHKLMFGTYNKGIEPCKTPFDWLNRDEEQVRAYMEAPNCGFPETAGLAREMLKGIMHIQKKKNLQKMNKHLPVLFIAGDADPVGNYGKGVRAAAEQFKKAGMENISCKLYKNCRHEILNELNKEEVYQDVADWVKGIIE